MSPPEDRSTEPVRLTGVVAIIRLRRPAPAPLLAALLDGGVHAVEVTLTTPDALTTLARWRGGGTGALVGAGTVRTSDDVDRSVDAGAAFLVTPTTVRAVLRRAAARDVPVLCGALTPSEIDAAWTAGAHGIKVFPAGAVGGPGYVRAVQAPLGDVPLFPTGGVDVEQTERYADLGCAGVGIGASLVDDATVEARDWPEITRRASAFTQAWGSATAQDRG